MYTAVTDLLAIFRITVKTLVLFIFERCYGIVKKPVKTKPSYFANERVLIIGGGRGIGKEVALQLASRNTKRITIWDTDETTLKKTTREIRQINGTSEIFSYVMPDLNKESIQDTIGKMKLESGDVSVLVNAIDNTDVKDKIITADMSSLLEVVQQELTVYTLAVKAFLPMMLELRHGCITIVVPPQTFSNKAKQSLYCASKAALHGYSKVLRTELNEEGYYGIKVACVCPWKNVVTSKHVAKSIIETISNNDSFVAVPPVMNYVHPLTWFLPNKLQAALMDAFTAKRN